MILLSIVRALYSKNYNNFYIGDSFTHTRVIIWLHMFVEKCYTLWFCVVYCVMSVIFIIIVIENILRVLEHPKLLILSRSNAQVNCTSSWSFGKNFNSLWHVMSTVKHIPQSISPRSSKSCSFHSVFLWNPNFFPNGDLLWDSCKDSNKANISNIDMLNGSFFTGMIHID